MTTNLLNPADWVSEYGDFLFNYALYRVSYAPVAEDLVQDTFLSALKGVDHFEGKSSERTWLISILKRKIIDYYRKSSRRKEEDTDFADQRFHSKGRWQMDNAPSHWEFDDSNTVENDEFNSILKRCIDYLPPRLAACFVMRMVDDLSGEEVCKELEISSSNLWVMLHRARLQLRECLEKNWFN